MFKLGQVVMTKGIASALEEDENFAMEVNTALAKYQLGDWGVTCDEDAEMNDVAVQVGERILAVYETYKGNIWIITEWNRSVTTILFPSEY